MKLKLLQYLVTATLALAGIAGVAQGAETVPPDTRDAAAMTASCLQPNGANLVIHGGRIQRGNDTVERVTVRIRNIEEEIGVSDLKSLRFEGAVDASGYLRSRVVLVDSTVENIMRVLIGRGGKSLILKGVNDRGERIAIGMDRCKAITFAPEKAPTVSN